MSDRIPEACFDLTRPVTDAELALISRLARTAVPRTLEVLKAAGMVGPDLAFLDYEVFCAYRGEVVEAEFAGETVVIDHGESWLLDEWLERESPRQD